MAEVWCTDTGEAVYRSRDAVKNLKIRYVNDSSQCSYKHGVFASYNTEER